MKSYKGVIFDLDGTLLNTIFDLSDSVNEVLKFFGFPTHNYEEYKLKIGKGFRNLIEVSLPEGNYDESIIDEALQFFVKIYDKKYMNKTKPYDGVTKILHELQDKGIKIAVNSNKRSDYTNALINKNFPDITFVEVIGEREGIPKKPDPFSALEIACKMDLDPEEILYIGDSKTDIQTGKNAGMDTAGVLWGFRNAQELAEHGAVHIVTSVEETIKLFS